MRIFFINMVMVTLFSYPSIAQNLQDKSGVYMTKDDFDKELIRYATPYQMKEKFGFLNSDFEYEAQGKLLLRQANKKLLSFEPGTIYGFYNKGKKYLYVPAIKKYLFVLNEKPVLIVIHEDVAFLKYNTHTNLRLFYLNKLNELKSMNDENISMDYPNTKLQLALHDIQTKFKGIERSRKLKTSEISQYIKDKFSNFNG